MYIQLLVRLFVFNIPFFSVQGKQIEAANAPVSLTTVKAVVFLFSFVLNGQKSSAVNKRILLRTEFSRCVSTSYVSC